MSVTLVADPRHKLARPPSAVLLFSVRNLDTLLAEPSNGEAFILAFIKVGQPRINKQSWWFQECNFSF